MTASRKSPSSKERTYSSGIGGIGTSAGIGAMAGTYSSSMGYGTKGNTNSGGTS